MGALRSILVLLRQLYPPDGMPDRDLDYAEFFAGKRSVSKGLDLFGFRGKSFDASYGGQEWNILQPIGFVSHLQAIMRLRPGGVLWAAPPCSTWVWLARGSCGRHKDIGGTATNHYVQSQNALVDRLVLLLRICNKRGVVWIIEQPSSSCMWRYPALAKLLTRRDCRRVALEMGAYGLDCPKATVLYGTAPHLEQLDRKLNSDEREELREDSKRRRTTTVEATAAGGWNVHGTADLKGTQAYTIEFGACHAVAYSNWRKTFSAAPEAAAGSSDAAPVQTGGNTFAEDSDSDLDEEPPYLYDVVHMKKDHWQWERT